MRIFRFIVIHIADLSAMQNKVLSRATRSWCVTIVAACIAQMNHVRHFEHWLPILVTVLESTRPGHHFPVIGNQWFSASIDVILPWRESRETAWLQLQRERLRITVSGLIVTRRILGPKRTWQRNSSWRHAACNDGYLLLESLHTKISEPLAVRNANHAITRWNVKFQAWRRKLCFIHIQTSDWRIQRQDVAKHAGVWYCDIISHVISEGYLIERFLNAIASLHYSVMAEFARCDEYTVY